jgi:ABC-type multidrug transport system ATPase subunit
VEPIVAESLIRRHRNGRGIDGVSLTLRAGQCLAALGSNGSGKTTLTRLVAGLDRSDQGRLFVLGEPACPRPRHLRKRCGVALDTPAHWETLSGRENLYFFARQYGLSRPHLAQRAGQLLDEADLAAQADDPVASYSFGMRRKLSIIEAMIHDPDLLILDEPSAGVDVAFVDHLVRWIRTRCDSGKTTWVADNDPDWLSRAATQAILLSGGRVEAEGPVRELMRSVGARHRIEIRLEKPGLEGVPRIAGIFEFHCEETIVTTQTNGDPGLPVELLGWITSHGGRIRAMEIHEVTLREALAQRAARRGQKP